MKHLTLKFCTIIIALLPIAAWGFDCETTSQELIETLPGTWTISNAAGTLTFNGQTMTLPPRNQATGEIYDDNGVLMAQDWNIPGVFPIEIVTDARFILDTTKSRVTEQGEDFFGPLPDFITGEEVRLLAGCKEGEISPQLSISGTFQDEEGPVEFQVYLFAITKNTLYGVTSGHLKSMNGHAKRITRWTRIN